MSETKKESCVPILTDPIMLVRQLDPDLIRQRLEDLDREREALLVLLRAALRVKPDGKAFRQNGNAQNA